MDPLSPIEEHQRMGLAQAIPLLQRTVRLAGKTYPCVRTELSIDTSELTFGGKKVKRIFTVLISRADLPSAVADGTPLLDDRGAKFFVSRSVGDATQQTLTCVGLWG